METGATAFRKHQRAIREALLKEEYELQECPASRGNKDLFSFLQGVSTRGSSCNE